MLDRTSLLWVNLPLAGIIHSQSNKFVTSVKIKVGDSKLNDSPGPFLWETRVREKQSASVQKFGLITGELRFFSTLDMFSILDI